MVMGIKKLTVIWTPFGSGTTQNVHQRKRNRKQKKEKLWEKIIRHFQESEVQQYLL